MPITEMSDVLDTVLDGGKTHIALNDVYAGNIDTYNNFVTRSFGWISGRSVTVSINGEKISANYYSLMDFMKSHGITNEQALKELEYRDLNSYKFWVIPLDGKERFMGAHLTQSKRELLSQDLFKAICSGDESLAKRKIRQGAELDQLAWLNEDTNHFHFKSYFATSLPHSHLNGQRYTHATPFLLAMRLNQVGVATLIGYHFAKTNLQGETLIFSREIVDDKTNVHFVPKVRRETVITRDAAGNQRTEVVRSLGLDVETSRQKFFLDRYENRNIMSHNPYTGTLDYTPTNDKETLWDTEHTSLIFPIM